MSRRVDLKVSSRKYCNLLMAIGCFLVLTHCVLYYIHYELTELPWLIRQLFDLDEENNLPTWFSSFLLLNCAAVLYLSLNLRDDQFRLHWRLLTLGFLILAIDEVAGLHESYHTAIDINWAIPGALVVFFAGFMFIPFLLSLERRLAALFLLSGVILVSGAIGVEWFSRDMDEDSLDYLLAVALEESLEMLGAWLFLRTNLVDLRESEVTLTMTT